MTFADLYPEGFDVRKQPGKNVIVPNDQLDPKTLNPRILAKKSFKKLFKGGFFNPLKSF